MRLVWFASALLAVQDEKPVFEDRFEGKLADGWTWLREVPDGHKVEGGALRIRSAPGTLWGKLNNAANVLLRKVPSSGIGLSMSIEATVTFSPAAPAEQAGLILRVSDDHYAKLVVEKVGDEVKIVLARELEGQGAALGIVPLKAPSVGLRLSWEANKLLAESRPEGSKEWAIVAYGETPFQGENVAITGGLFAHGGPQEGARWAEFRHFKVRFFE
jgi:regulation of enolase protein 1 (concanavalin A-like superfamily)